MKAVENKSEKVLEGVFVVLLFLSLACFAGIPAMEQEPNNQPIIIKVAN